MSRPKNPDNALKPRQTTMRVPCEVIDHFKRIERKYQELYNRVLTHLDVIDRLAAQDPIILDLYKATDED